MVPDSDSNSNSSLQNRKFQRRSTKHVKSGCKICKARRVKCDENKPACDRCTSTGRTCDYGIWSTGTNSHNSVQQFGFRTSSPLSRTGTPGTRHDRNVTFQDCQIKLSLNLGVNSDELTCFEFFQIRCLIKLPGFFDRTFWERIVPQLSATEPAVFHAVIALASTQRSQEYTSCIRSGQGYPYLNYDYEVTKWDHFALQQYNKAITHLKSHFEGDNHRSVQIALTTCIIFICIELMRGSYSLANLHIDHGISVLKTLQQQQQRRQISEEASTNNMNSETIIRPLGYKSTDDHIMEIFARMNTQSVLFGYPSRYLHTTVARHLSTDGIPETFASMQDCRQCLEVLVNNALHLVNRAMASINSPSSSSYPVGNSEHAVSDTKEELLTALRTWKRSYQRTFADDSLFISAYRTYLAFVVLRIYSNMIEIMLGVCPGPNEIWDDMRFDKYTDLFNDILAAASELVWMRKFPGHFVPEAAPCSLAPLNFSADMGLVPALYYTAVKCRDPLIRRRAITFLQVVPHREAVWDGMVVAGAAETIVRLEESGFYDACRQDTRMISSSSSRSLPLDHHGVPLPASYRFQEVRLLLDDGLEPRGKVLCHRKRDGSHSQPLKGTINSGWETIEELFECGERLNTYTWSTIRARYNESPLAAPAHEGGLS